MLCEKTLNDVVGFAMAKYATDNNGKIGVSKTDVIELVHLHGGCADDVRGVMLLAFEHLMPKGTYLM